MGEASASPFPIGGDMINFMRFGVLCTNTLIVCLFLYATSVFASDPDATNRTIVVNEDGVVVDVINDGTFERLAVDANITNIETTVEVRPGTFIAEPAVDSGSSSDLNIDGSSTPVVFNIVPNSGKKFFVHRVIIVIQDQGISFLKFGGITGGLTNGVAVEVQEGGESIRDIGAFGNIKLNSQFSFGGGGISLTSASTDLFQVTFDIAAVGTAFELVDSDSDFLRFTVNDNLTTIDQFKIVAQGYEVDE